MKKFLFLGVLVLVIGTLVTSSCTKEVLSDKKELLSFTFESTKNSQFDRNHTGVINGYSVVTEVPFTTDVTILVPTTEISPNATIDPIPTITDFTKLVTYKITAEDGTSKIFAATVAKSSAPYLGNWTSTAMDYGEGLMKLNAEFTEDGNITLEFIMILTGEKNNNSIKGTFNPISAPDKDIMITQNQIWSTNTWMNKEDQRTFLYHINSENSMVFYYCLTYPKTDWCFQINMTK